MSLDLKQRLWSLWRYPLDGTLCVRETKVRACIIDLDSPLLIRVAKTEVNKMWRGNPPSGQFLAQMDEHGVGEIVQKINED